METTRQQKIARQIQRDVAEIFRKEAAPALLGTLVTVTAVRVSPDFGYAKIYVSVFPFERSGEVMSSLEASTRLVRGALGQRIRNQLRNVPEIQFFLDDSLEYVEQIDRALRSDQYTRRRMTLSQLFARRYLFSPKSHSVINLIAGVSVVAVAMPVAAMIILLSVFNGFEQLARSMCATFDADLTVMPVRGQTFDAAAIDTAAVAALPEVAALTLVAEQSVLLEHGERQVIARVRGVDDRYGEVFPVAASVTAGRYEVRLGDLDRVVLGQGMAYDLGVRSLADTRIGIYAIRRGSFSSLLPLDGYTRRTVPVSGLYSLDAETESRYALTSLRLAQELFGYDGRATGLLVRLRNGADARAGVPAVERLAGEAFAVRTREQMNPSFYRIVAYEKWGVFFISLLVLVVASFSVVGALSMLMIDKRDDVRTLRALGADTSLVRRIFIREGLLIGGLGAVIGLVLGVGCSLVQQR